MTFTKKLGFAAIAALFGIFSVTSLSSCSKDDENSEPSDGQVPTAVAQSFKSMFPNAQNVEWEKNGSYYIAEFNKIVSEDYDVWFKASDASWAMTQIDYGKNLFMIPASLNASFEQTEYATWTIDNISLYERPDASFYIFEVEKTGNPDMAVIYTKAGQYVNAVAESVLGDITPTTVIE